MYAFKPGTRLLATAWFQGGINIIDVENPAAAEEIAYYQSGEDFSPWAVYWDGNLLWTSDEHGENGGVEVFKFTP